MIEGLEPNVTLIRASWLDGGARFKSLALQNRLSSRSLTAVTMSPGPKYQIVALRFHGPANPVERAMKTSAGRQSERPPWYLWPLVPLVLPIGLVIMLPFGLLALLSIPFYLVFPDTHPHKYDALGTPSQTERLARWRAHYRRIGLRRRIRRSVKLWRRGREWRRRRNGVTRPLDSMRGCGDVSHPLWDKIVDQ
jgi:hypothetical protein